MVPENIRIKFKKTGRLKYISHLDLCRTMQPAMIRAKIPLWYTEGFNPHPKMVFAQPLPQSSKQRNSHRTARYASEQRPQPISAPRQLGHGAAEGQQILGQIRRSHMSRRHKGEGDGGDLSRFGQGASVGRISSANQDGQQDGQGHGRRRQIYGGMARHSQGVVQPAQDRGDRRRADRGDAPQGPRRQAALLIPADRGV